MTESSLYNAQLLSAKQFIETHDHFLVVSHIHPDGDAASSTCAVGLLLKQLDKQYTLINEGPVPEKFHPICGSDNILNLKELGEFPNYEAVIAVDCADYSRMGDIGRYIPDHIPLLNIDHHPTNDCYGTAFIVQPNAAATAEILYDLIELMDIQWTKQLSNCIYTGILTDTGGFRYSNTSPKVLKMASHLLEYGAKASELAESLLEETSRAHVEILKRALNTLSFSENHQIAWVIVKKEDMWETKAKHEDLEGIVNYPRNIHGVEVGIMFKEMNDGTVKCSFRSAGKIDVSAVAQSFGGGGHVRASGATLQGSVDEVIQKVVKEVKRVLNG